MIIALVEYCTKGASVPELAGFLVGTIMFIIVALIASFGAAAFVHNEGKGGTRTTKIFFTLFAILTIITIVGAVLLYNASWHDYHQWINICKGLGK